MTPRYQIQQRIDQRRESQYYPMRLTITGWRRICKFGHVTYDEALKCLREYDESLKTPHRIVHHPIEL